MIKLIIALILIYSSAYCQIEIEKIQISCDPTSNCIGAKILHRLKGDYKSQNYLDSLLQVICRQNGIEKISYTLKNKTIKFDVKSFPFINKIDIELAGRAYTDGPILPISVGDFFSTELEKRTSDYLEEYFSNLGYKDVTLNLKKNKNNQGVSLVYEINYTTLTRIKEINVNSSELSLKEKIDTYFASYLNEKYERINFSTALEDLKQTLFESGYYFIDISSQVTDSVNGVLIDLHIKNPERQAFRVYGISTKLKQEITTELKNTTRVYKRILSETSIKEIVSSKLRRDSFYNAKFEVETIDLLDKENLVQTIVRVDKGLKARVLDISFRGNSFFSEKELRAFFYENASGKALYDYPDIDYYKNFIGLLKRKYIESGFTSVQIREPSLKFLSGSAGRVVFKVVEGQRTKVLNVTISGAEEVSSSTLLNLFQMKSSYFDPIQFAENLAKLREEMFELGFYYFKIKNINDSDLVSYTKDNAAVSIKLNLKLGEKIKFRKVKIFGNTKTKDALFYKYLNIQKNEILTRKKIREYQSSLLSLGLFKSLNIIPLEVSAGSVDLIVQVKESDFGLIELAPGVRSDLGPKFSGSISYTNLGGMNRVASLKVEVNRRFDLKSLSEERRDDKSLVEYETELSFNENKVFDTNFNFFTSISNLRSRFYTFDADIQKVNYTVSTDFTNWFRASFTQQLESVSQFNSVGEAEEGKYEIGSITPSVTFDFRNNRINPTKGAYFSLSFERASPGLKSQNDDELKVDYYKLVSRNFFYIPFKNGTFAISLAGGVQENLAKNLFDNNGNAAGYIPNVKVFRLSGMDLVRGYDDSEINTLIDGDDISTKVITDKAYMVNLKIEPRFFVSDNFIAGVFFDAGRVFVDKFESNQLRSSYGITFKYLTPVGTLDFDYGIKTLRKKDSSGKLESPGRLHVSIGFF